MRRSTRLINHNSSPVASAKTLSREYREMIQSIKGKRLILRGSPSSLKVSTGSSKKLQREVKKLIRQTNSLHSSVSANENPTNLKAQSLSDKLLTKILPSEAEGAVSLRRSPRSSPRPSPTKRGFSTSELFSEAQRNLSLQYHPKGGLASRSTEHQQLLSLIVNKKNKSGAVYVTGDAGTGKTALISRVLLPQLLRYLRPAFSLFVNAMADIEKPLHLYSLMQTQLSKHNDEFEISSVKGKSSSRIHVKRRIEALLMEMDRPFLLIVDEIDLLGATKEGRCVVLQLFRWASSTRLILIGIGNKLDYLQTDLFGLEANAIPEVFRFFPYTSHDIVCIIRQRVPQIAVFQPSALEYLSRSLANRGDIRKALETCRLAVEEAIKLRRFEPIGVTNIASVLQQTCESKEASISMELPFQQQVLLCALMEGPSELTVNELAGKYSLLCDKELHIPPVGGEALHDALHELRSVGLLCLRSTGGHMGSWKVILRADSKEIARGLRQSPSGSLLARFIGNSANKCQSRF